MALCARPAVAALPLRAPRRPRCARRATATAQSEPGESQELHGPGKGGLKFAAAGGGYDGAFAAKPYTPPARAPARLRARLTAWHLPPTRNSLSPHKRMPRALRSVGYCTFENVREALSECDSLEGPALEACWAQSGCDLDAVTEHYKHVAEVENVGEHSSQSSGVHSPQPGERDKKE